ncbi:MAG: lipase [Frankiaceae bacterium]|jgi:pimeloyl-ACP methyl ester carboxylesterase|nr:lipase [Frankiaceae bacterium]
MTAPAGSALASTALGVAPPPAGGIDFTLPGDGVRLGATRWPGDGAPIVLMHGLASQRRFWNLVVPHLRGLPLIAVDLRGHGDSDRPAQGYELTTVASDIGTAMDALGWSRAVVVGHSWGGSVAATFAAEHPERALAMLAIDGGFLSLGTTGQDRAALRGRLEPPRWALPPDELVKLLSGHGPAGRWTPELAAAVLPIFEVGADGLARARLPFETHMAIVDTLLDYQAEVVLAQVRCPAWLVSCEALGGADDFAAARAAALERLPHTMANPRILRWGGAVHDVPLQWPALVAGLIRAAAEDAAAPA